MAISKQSSTWSVWGTRCGGRAALSRPRPGTRASAGGSKRIPESLQDLSFEAPPVAVPAPGTGPGEVPSETSAVVGAGVAPGRSRAGRRTTTQFLAGIGSGLLAGTDGVGVAGRAATPRFLLGGMRCTTTAVGGTVGAAFGTGRGSTLGRGGTAGAARARRGRRVDRRRGFRGGVADGSSAARTLSRTAFRTMWMRSATNAATIASTSASMLIRLRRSVRTAPASSSTLLARKAPRHM
jgi:hypothetical protein